MLDAEQLRKEQAIKMLVGRRLVPDVGRITRILWRRAKWKNRL